MAMDIVITDGGKKLAGIAGNRDCVVRAIAIATEREYQQVYLGLCEIAKRERPKAGKRRSSTAVGFQKATWKKYMLSLGWKWVPTMHIGSGCTVHLRSDELPCGRLVVSVSRHLVAVIDGVIHDNHDCTRDGSRCVYGYFVNS